MKAKNKSKFTLEVTAEELDTIADGLRTVHPRYDLPGNKYYKSINHMLYVIDDIRGYHDKKDGRAK